MSRTLVQIGLLCVALQVGFVRPAAPQNLPPAAPRDTIDEYAPAASPRGAFFRSLVVPGWGQAYAGSPGRGAVYFSLAGASLWMSYVARRQLADANAQQAFLRQTGEIGPDDETGFVAARSQQFEDWAALSIFLFFFAGADAYVSAYLADFDERIGVAAGNGGSFELRATIPFAPHR